MNDGFATMIVVMSDGGVPADGWMVDRVELFGSYPVAVRRAEAIERVRGWRCEIVVRTEDLLVYSAVER